MTFDAGSALELLVPLLLVMGAAFAWDAWSRPATPPRLAPYQVKFGWQVDPVATLSRELLNGRLTTAIVTLHDRLIGELSGRYRLTAKEIRRAWWTFRRQPDLTVERACRLVSALEYTFLLAARAEDPRRTDLWSRWRKPRWGAAARERLSRELSETEALWPALTRSA